MILEALMIKNVSASRNDFFAFFPKSGHFSNTLNSKFEKSRKLQGVSAKILIFKRKYLSNHSADFQNFFNRVQLWYSTLIYINEKIA